jgi:nucleotide-binding universal stress UspA family protein
MDTNGYRLGLITLDGSATAEAVLPYARALASGGARLILLRIVPSDSTAAECLVARSYLQAVQTGLAQSGVEGADIVVAPETGAGPPGAIVAQATERDADLIVMATHGRSGLSRVLYGSVAEQVLHLTALPALLVPALAPWPWDAAEPRRILVPLDGSHLALAALPAADALARTVGAELHLVRVLEPPDAGLYHSGVRAALFDPAAAESGARRYLSGLAACLPAATRTAGIHVVSGEPGGAIAAAARELRAGTIAMATHGRFGATRVVLGSVATSVLRRAVLPMLLFHPVGLGATPVAAGLGREA